MARPRLIHYGIKELDYYPKGTTCFLAPRELVINAYKNFKTNLQDMKFVNDDSALIRLIVEEADLYMAPQFAFTYHYARSTLGAFIRHTFHRGIVFIDGFMRTGSRYLLPLIAYLILLPVILITIALKPFLILLALPAMVLLWLILLLLKVSINDANSFIIVLPLFAVIYSAGLYKGLLLRFREGLR